MNYVVRVTPPNHKEIEYTVVDAKNSKEAEERFKDYVLVLEPALILDGLQIFVDYA